VLDVPAPALRLVLDPGHGAPGNSGNTNARCELEQDVMLRVAGRVAPALRERGLTVDLSRATNEVSYDDRLALTNTRDVLVSLHSDARAGTSATLGPGGCRQTLGASGLSVLWSDEGPVELVERRHRLARAVARRMGQAGFHLYEGTDYLSLYEGDEVAGVFVDRHAIDERIRLLRRPLVPSIIIETHDAGDVGEVARWEDPATSTAFAAALAAGIADAWAPPAVPSTQWGPPPSGSGP
jgi:N-acetylmuramoyl-L-alanine amidase